MSLSQREWTIKKQQRAYIIGYVELIEGQWFFFDEIEEQAFQLEEIKEEIEIYIGQAWEKAVVVREGQLKIKGQTYPLRNGEPIRCRKRLPMSLEKLLFELDDESFHGFISTLNHYSYSLFDCIFCHFFLDFLQQRYEKKGTNTIIFDNGDLICTVLHHFDRSNEKYEDRFEFTLSDGSRIFCSKMKRSEQS
jgi:hypothetical protein